jgi:hypothetical protein
VADVDAYAETRAGASYLFMSEPDTSNRRPQDLRETAHPDAADTDEMDADVRDRETLGVGPSVFATERSSGQRDPKTAGARPRR